MTLELDSFKSTITRLTKLSTTHYVIAWLVVRTWAVLCGFGHFPYPMQEFLFSDIQLYDWWAGNILDGHFPINDEMWQYPPLAAVVFAVGYAIAPNSHGFVALELIADFAVLIMLLSASRALAKQNNGRTNYTPALIWVASPLIMGPVMLGRFDMFPTAIAVAAILLSTNARASGILAATGTLLKVWPALLLAGTKRARLLPTLAWYAFSLVLGGSLLKHFWSDSFGFLSEQKARGLQIESVGALPFMIWNATSHSVTSEFRYGAIEVIADGTGISSLIMTITGLLLIGSLAWWRLTGRLETALASDVILTVVLIAIATSRVLSPQYMVWVLGLISVGSLYGSELLRKVAPLMFISSFLGQLMYPWLYISFQEGKVFATAVHGVRIVTLVLAVAISWNHLRRTAYASGSKPLSIESTRANS